MDPSPPGRAIPLRLDGRSSATIDRAARFGDGWMPYMYSLGKSERDKATLVARSAESGRGCLEAAVHAFAVLSDAKLLSTVYGQSFDEATV